MIVIETKISYNILRGEGMDAKIKSRLDSIALNIFPESGRWGAGEYNRPENSLIGHLRDEEWLSRRLQEDLKDIPLDTIKEYVHTSSEFSDAREAYEQRIVKWQIEWMMNDGENWLVPDGYGEEFIKFHEDYDKGFRLGVVKTLSAIGMHIDAIEKGIEVNADLWRIQVMRGTFFNRYNPIIGFMSAYTDIEEPREEHISAWIKMRLYQYYQEHRDSVDKYGVRTPDMELSDEEAEWLDLYLNKLHEERMAYINEIKSQPRTQSKSLINRLIQEDQEKKDNN